MAIVNRRSLPLAVHVASSAGNTIRRASRSSGTSAPERGSAWMREKSPVLCRSPRSRSAWR